VLFAFIAIEQAPVPVHAPLQPMKAEPLAGVSLKLTWVPAPKLAVHVPEEQFMPFGELFTFPLPETVTERVYNGD